jgi:hypothetical protein
MGKTSYRFNPPPTWPTPPPGWTPPAGWIPDSSWPPPPPGWVFWLPNPRSALAWSRRRVRATIALLVVLGAVAYTVPLLGFGVSLLIPFIAHWSRHVLWPRASTTASFIWASLVVVGIWWTVVALFLLPVSAVSFDHGVFWLIVPLCGPRHIAAWVVPALTATTAYTLGLAGTAWLRRPGPWLVGAWVAPLAYQVAMTWLVDNTFIC